MVCGDGLAGYAAGGPYDRLIAFCAVTRVPAAWIEQCRVGGVIVVTLTGGLTGFGLLRLTVDENGSATGRFLPDDVSFMTVRAQANPRPIDLKRFMGERNGPSRTTELSPNVLSDPAFRFTAQLAMPKVMKFALRDENGVYATYLQHHHDGSWARVEHADGGTCRVLQGGTRRLWDELEDAYGWWRETDSPGVERYGVTVAAGRQVVRVDQGGREWEMPT